MKKGFTLIELLSVIIILAIILVIVVPQVLKTLTTTRTKVYETNEKMMENSAENYLANNVSLIPNEEYQIYVISLDDLIQNKFISEISVSQVNCDGFVVAKNKKEIEYKSYLKCGENYETEGYENLETLTNVEALVVAGGGGGGYRHGGGGGAGGLIFNENVSVSLNVEVTVGAGGNGSTHGTIRPQNGQNSSFGNLIAIGGGGAGQWDGGFATAQQGGSGGGSSNLSIASGVLNQGNQGGSGAEATTPYNHGGGGGAAEAGFSGTLNSHGNGGSGLYFGDKFGDFSGDNGWFAGGGGGGGHNPTAEFRGLGGIGGGGSGGIPGVMTSGDNAIINTGGGGGGASTPSGGTGIGGNGGSGIVLVRYQGLPKANGGEIYEFNGYTIHAFKKTGQNSFSIIEF